MREDARVAWLRLADQKAPQVIRNGTRVKQRKEPSGVYREPGQRSRQADFDPSKNSSSAANSG